MFNTVKAWLSVMFVTIIFGTLAIILTKIKRSIAFDYAVRPWGKYILKGCGIRLEVQGVENLPEEPCIIMYNHSSAFDIMAFSAAMPIEWVTIIKNEVAKVPIIGTVCKLTGQYFVSRDGSSGDLHMVKEIAEKIKNGPSVLIAPEGTRSEDGNLLPFKKGGFVIALRAKVPVVTMVITGGRDIKSKNSRHVKPGVMKIKFFEPIYVDKFEKGRAGREKLQKLVRDQMEAVLKEERKLKMAV